LGCALWFHAADSHQRHGGYSGGYGAGGGGGGGYGGGGYGAFRLLLCLAVSMLARDTEQHYTHNEQHLTEQ
jgi:hypothetical protein